MEVLIQRFLNRVDRMLVEEGTVPFLALRIAAVWEVALVLLGARLFHDYGGIPPLGFWWTLVKLNMSLIIVVLAGLLSGTLVVIWLVRWRVSQISGDIALHRFRTAAEIERRQQAFPEKAARRRPFGGTALLVVLYLVVVMSRAYRDRHEAKTGDGAHLPASEQPKAIGWWERHTVRLTLAMWWVTALGLGTWWGLEDGYLLHPSPFNLLVTLGLFAALGTFAYSVEGSHNIAWCLVTGGFYGLGVTYDAAYSNFALSGFYWEGLAGIALFGFVAVCSYAILFTLLAFPVIWLLWRNRSRPGEALSVVG